MILGDLMSDDINDARLGDIYRNSTQLTTLRFHNTGRLGNGTVLSVYQAARKLQTDQQNLLRVILSDVSLPSVLCMTQPRRLADDYIAEVSLESHIY